MFAQLLQRLGGGAALAAAGGFLGEHLDRAVHADGEDLVDLLEVGVEAAMLDEGPVAADARLDRFAIVGVGADLARKAEQGQGLLERHVIGAPALGQAGAGRLLVLFGDFAALDVRPEAARAQADLVAVVFAQHAVARLAGIARDGAGVAAFGVARAADEAAGAGGFEVESPLAAERAGARVGAVFAGRVEHGRECLVELVDHLGGAQLGGFGDGGREVAPEIGEHLLVVGLARADDVELFL